MRRKIKLRTKMLLLSFVLVSVSVTVSGFTMLYSISASFEAEIGERATAIARTIAQLDEIRSSVGRDGGEEVIQPIVERIRLSTNVDYIVVLDNDRVRYSHPSESFIGQVFEGGDERAAFSELEYTSKAEGELGFAIRSFVPIMNEEGVNQVGVVVVGILAPNLQELLNVYHHDLLFSLLGGLLIGLIGAWFLANNVKKQTYQLEPYEIARLFEERSTIMEALDIGIIATDNHGKISYMNQLALTYIDKEVYTIQDIFSTRWVERDILKKEIVTNRSINLDGTIYLLSIYPLFVKEQYVGSLLKLQNRSAVHELGEELTGVKALVGALRAQNHKYMNKLHSIAGLIQLEKTEQAFDLIMEESLYEKDIVQYMNHQIEDYAISGLLLGKQSRARELGVEFSIDAASYLQEIMRHFSTGDVITILGNLLDNAFEACQEQTEKEVNCLIQGNEDLLYVRVEDTGVGITDKEKKFIFNEGYSSKAMNGRGMGLAMVKEIVDLKDGDIQITANNTGTTAIVEIHSLG